MRGDKMAYQNVITKQEYVSNDIIERMKEEQEHTRRLWTKEEEELLKRFIREGITSAQVIKKFGFFPNKSNNAVRLKIKYLKEEMYNE